MAEPAILALVLGRCCGWAASAGFPSSGMWPLARSRPLPGTREVRHGRAFAIFGDNLAAALDRAQAGVVVYERAPATLRGEALDVHRGQRGVLLSVCWLRHVEPVEVAAGTWRSWLGAPAGADAMAAVRALGFEPSLPEEAAALGLRAWSLATLGREGRVA